jgi:DNA-binding NtrC family response regulator
MTDGDCIQVPDLPAPLRFSAARELDLTRPLAEVEADYIRNVLASVGDNRTKAAEVLQIDRKTLREKLKKIEPPQAS